MDQDKPLGVNMFKQLLRESQNELKEYLDRNLAKRIDEVLGPLKETVNVISNRIDGLAKEIEEVRQIAISNSGNNSNDKGTETRLTDASSSRSIQGRSGTDSSFKDSEYERAKRTLRLWPVRGLNKEEMLNNLCCFLRDIMRSDPIERSQIKSIKRTTAGRRSKAHNVVEVEMDCSQTRDTINRCASNLAGAIDAKGNPTAGVMIEIPDHLVPDFNVLQRYGYMCRSRYGRSLKRNIRLCDEEKGVKLDIKFPWEDDWMKMSPDFVRQLLREEQEKENMRLRERLSQSSYNFLSKEKA